MKTVPTVSSVGTTVNGKNQFVGTQICDATVDPNWTVYLRSTQFTDPQQIPWNYVMVDNIANNGVVTIKFLNFSFSVPQFTRKSFRLPDQTTNVQLSFSVGQVTLYFLETPDLVSSDANLYNITTAAGTNVVYTWDNETATVVNQILASHSNRNIAFSNANPQTFNLLAATSVPNGYINPQLWCIGPGTLTIVPNGTDTINGFGGPFTSGAPLVLQPGDKISLSCDGTQWYAANFKPTVYGRAEKFQNLYNKNSGITYLYTLKVNNPSVTTNENLTEITCDLTYGYPLGFVCQNIATGFGIIKFADAGNVQRGSISWATTTSIQYNTTSDATIKTVLPEQPDYVSAIRGINVVTFTYNEDPNQTPQLGVLAQQACPFYPQAFTPPRNKNDLWQADYSHLAPLALWGVKDLYNKLAAQQATIERLSAALTQAGIPY